MMLHLQISENVKASNIRSLHKMKRKNSVFEELQALADSKSGDYNLTPDRVSLPGKMLLKSIL